MDVQETDAVSHRCGLAAVRTAATVESFFFEIPRALLLEFSLVTFVGVDFGVFLPSQAGSKAAMETEHWVHDERIYGPVSYSGFFIQEGRIYGPTGETHFRLEDGRIVGPDGDTGYKIEENRILGPAAQLPWGL